MGATEMQPTHQEMTTAEALGQYYKDLLDHGLPVHIAEQLVMTAARPLHEACALVVGKSS